MGKYQEERKTPVIVVKKRRTFSPPSLSEKTDIIAPVFTEQTAESAPRRNKFICRRNTYPRSASQEEEKEKTPFSTSLPLDP